MAKWIHVGWSQRHTLKDVPALYKVFRPNKEGSAILLYEGMAPFGARARLADGHPQFVRGTFVAVQYRNPNIRPATLKAHERELVERTRVPLKNVEHNEDAAVRLCAEPRCTSRVEVPTGAEKRKVYCSRHQPR